MSPSNPVLLPPAAKRGTFVHSGQRSTFVEGRPSAEATAGPQHAPGALLAEVTYVAAVSGRPMDSEQTGLEATADGEKRRERVLIVDDERDIRESLQSLIEAEFPQVCVQAVGSGRAALEVMRRDRVDVVISDYRMPEMNGLELLDRIQAMAPAARLGLISAYNDPKMGNHTSFPQLSFFLSKPIEVGTFVAHTKRLLNVD